VYSYTLPHDFEGFWGTYSRTLQAIGGRVSLKTGWDLIPFSFILDWIFPIGDFLDQWKMEAFPVNVVIRDLCLSLRVKKEAVEWRRGACYTGGKFVPVGSLRTERFTREILEEIPFDFSAQLPSFLQFSLGTALAVTVGSTLKTKSVRETLKNIRRFRGGS
jgi:hypothetical protein